MATSKITVSLAQPRSEEAVNEIIDRVSESDVCSLSRPVRLDVDGADLIEGDDGLIVGFSFDIRFDDEAEGARDAAGDAIDELTSMAKELGDISITLPSGKLVDIDGLDSWLNAWVDELERVQKEEADAPLLGWTPEHLAYLGLKMSDFY